MGLHLGQRLTAVLPGHVQVEQDQAGPGGALRVRMRPALVEIVQHFLTVLDELQITREVGLLERVRNQQAVVGVVIRNEHRRRASCGHAPAPTAGRCSGRVTTNVAPCPGWLVTLMVPPWRSAIRRLMASPIPVPSYSVRLWSR